MTTVMKLPECGFELVLFGPLNPAVTEILNGERMRAISLATAVRAKALYQGVVAFGDSPEGEHLRQVVDTFTIKTYTTYGPRWTGVMEVSEPPGVKAPHFLHHELGWTDPRTGGFHAGAHDLNQVLELL